MRHFKHLLAVAALFALFTGARAADGIVRDTISLNTGWQFHYGEEHTGWTEVDLPHDFQISQPWIPPQANDRGDRQNLAANFFSILSSRGFKEMGCGWYKKTLSIPESLKGNRILLDFQGIMLVGDVYLDGERIGGTDYGYLGFDIDITRHSLFIRTLEADASSAQVAVQATVTKQSQSREPGQTVRLGVRLLDADGQVAAEMRTQVPYNRYIASAGEYEIGTLQVPSPRLWSCEDPYLYTVEVSLYDDSDELHDRVCEPFGIRTVEFSPEFGLKLNGKKVILKGAANHHSMGPVGAAAFPRVEEYQLKMFKSFGYNHIRTSHNPYSESFLRACDRLGILVVDELYDKWDKNYAGGRKDWKDLWENDLTEFVLRDRNHPCVVLWSYGNELQMNKEPFGDFGVTAYRLQRELQHRYDDTRLSTVAMHPSYRNWETTDYPCELAKATDIASYNYRYMYFPGDRKNYPYMIFYQSEANTTGIPGNWFGMELDKVIGLAYWGAIDYLGESGGWPAKGWAQGAFDMSWEPKPYAYLVQSMFEEKPIVHLAIIEQLAPENIWNGINVGTDHMSENWNRTPGEILNLYTFTNGDEVELFVNGKSQGVKKNTDEPANRNRIKWEGIPYQKGSIEAVARKDGRVVARHRLETTGKAVALRVEPAVTDWKADGKDVQIVRLTAVDSRGRRVWTADDELTFAVSGDAAFVGTSSGDITSGEIYTEPKVKLFQGTAVALIRSGEKAGPVTLTILTPLLKKPVTQPLQTQ